MVQNLNDIYNLLKQSEYKTYSNCDWKFIGTHDFYNGKGDRIQITFGNMRFVVYKFHNMNSEYYETVSVNNENTRAMHKKFKALLYKKHTVANLENANKKQR